MDTMKVTIIGPNLRDQSKGSHHVHAAGCADIQRTALRDPAYRVGWTIEATSEQQVVTDVYDPSNFQYDPNDWDDYAAYRGDIHFFPCCDGLTSTN